MRFNSDKMKPMSEQTKKLGTQFVRALIQEGHGYDSVKSNVVSLLAKEAIEIANEKLAATPGAIRESSGRFRGVVGAASKLLGVTGNQLRFMWAAGNRDAKGIEAR
jgi:hypothetical protein